MDDEMKLTSEQRLRFIAAAERALRVRREILLLAGHACGHLPGDQRMRGQRMCRECKRSWPCKATFDAARPALDAVAALDPCEEIA